MTVSAIAFRAVDYRLEPGDRAASAEQAGCGIGVIVSV